MLWTNCPVATSYSSWNFDARCAFTWSCDTRTCESDEISFSAMAAPLLCFGVSHRCCTPIRDAKTRRLLRHFGRPPGVGGDEPPAAEDHERADDDERGDD